MRNNGPSKNDKSVTLISLYILEQKLEIRKLTVNMIRKDYGSYRLHNFIIIVVCKHLDPWSLVNLAGRRLLGAVIAQVTPRRRRGHVDVGHVRGRDLCEGNEALPDMGAYWTHSREPGQKKLLENRALM